MDAEDTRIAQERIDHAEARLAVLRTQGLDPTGLNSQLMFARAALREGRTLDVLALCEEVLLSARRLETGSGPRIRTDRLLRPLAASPEPAPNHSDVSYPSGLYAPPGTEALDRQRLTEEIRQVVQADLMPKALSSAQLHDRINKSVAKAFDDHLTGFRAELEERFKRLVATPETKDFARREPAAPALDVPALLSDLEQRLDARTAGIARSTAEAINDATAGLEQRLNQLTDPERLRLQISGAVDDAVRNGMATIELQRQESAARNAVGTLEDHVRDRATLDRLATAIDQLDQTVATRVATAMAGATEAIAGPIRDLVGDVLGRAAPPDLEAVTQKLAQELRLDLDWQVERLAAERGWVSIADVQAEVARTGGGGATAPAPSRTFARLEAALVEFVNQSQAQQQQFLSVLQQRVEQSAEAVTKNLAKVLIDENHRSSALFRTPAPDRHDADPHAALESLVPKAPSDHDLDVLSQTAQYRAISALSVPPPPGTAAFLPGTFALRRTMERTVSNDGTRQTIRQKADSAPVTEEAPTLIDLDSRDELRSDVMELTPVVHAVPAPSPAAIVIRPSEAIPSEAADESLPLTGDLSYQPETDRQAALDPASGRLEPTSSEPAGPYLGTNPETGTIAPGTCRLVSDDSGILAATPAQPEPPTTSVPATASDAPITTRSGTLEAGLRHLVKSEIERQLTGGLRETLRRALGLDQPAVTPAVLAAQVDEALTKAMAGRDQLSGASLAPTATNDANRSALPMPWTPLAHSREDLVRLLHEPAVRQEVLGIVAVEVLANPGALAELSGIRAFIRSEVGNAAKELADAAHVQGTHRHGDPALA